MTTVSTDAIKALRERTGAGVMDCKKALEDAKGDVERAAQLLREKGMVIAAQKASRETRQGVIEAYLHGGGRIGAMVELNCETDFVARTDAFKELAHDLAMQVAAMGPLYLDAGDIPAGAQARPEEVCLLKQPFIKDPSKNVQTLITEVVAKVGENVRVRRFARFALGEQG